LESYIIEELNVVSVVFTADEVRYGVEYACTGDWKILGKKYGNAVKGIKAGLATLGPEDVKNYMKKKTINIAGVELDEHDLVVSVLFWKRT